MSNSIHQQVGDRSASFSHSLIAEWDLALDKTRCYSFTAALFEPDDCTPVVVKMSTKSFCTRAWLCLAPTFSTGGFIRRRRRIRYAEGRTKEHTCVSWSLWWLMNGLSLFPPTIETDLLDQHDKHSPNQKDGPSNPDGSWCESESPWSLNNKNLSVGVVVYI